MRIAFLCGDIVGVSGGAIAIFEHARGLIASGHEVTLVTPEPVDRREIRWHPDIATEGLRIETAVAVGGERYDFAFATFWRSVYDLASVDARVYGWFNQSLESRFTSSPADKLSNRAAYGLPLFYVPCASWLAEFIRAVSPEATVRVLLNGLNRAFFPLRPPERNDGGPLRVLVEGPFALERKGVPMALRVLERAAKRVPLEVGWMTHARGGARPSVGGRAVAIHEGLAMAEVHRVYRGYDVLLKLSVVEGMFGPPLEMFSQGGTVITTNVTGHEEYVRHGDNALVVQRFNAGVIPELLGALHRDRELLHALKLRAHETAAAWPTREESTRRFEAILAETLATMQPNAHLRRPLAALAAMRREAEVAAQRSPAGGIRTRCRRFLWRVWDSIPAPRRRWIKRHLPDPLLRRLLGVER